ncbi:tyrosine-type recombinase/integrase [Solicola sp. PLA-1-18]|uniref:tyrosine-type recombinase/integrase n=1 Tax=Solicola sp. PLA-1-18 TaxID=3380532 RepID=UPI003B816D56
MPPRKRKRSFGNIRRLPSKRYQANYTAPDGVIYNAPWTFDAAEDAEAWLAAQRQQISLGAWVPPNEQHAAPITFGEYADLWLKDRTLKPRTKDHYAKLIESRLKPTFGSMALKTVSPAAVRRWHTEQGSEKPTMRAHAYSLLRSILATAVNDELITVNPCHIRGAGNSKRVHKIKPATLPELEALVSAMPDKYKVMTLLAAWCGLRFGELTELRRKDVDLEAGVLQIRRAVVRVEGKTIIGTPKSDAGVRNVAIPPHLMPALKDHLASHAQPGKSGLLFPSVAGTNLQPSTLYKSFYAAREKALRPDLRWHDLRHTGAVLAASTGATLAELMGRLGHSTPGAALRYQHAAQGRDMEIAKALSKMVVGDLDA